MLRLPIPRPTTVRAQSIAGVLKGLLYRAMLERIVPELFPSDGRAAIASARLRGVRSDAGFEAYATEAIERRMGKALPPREDGYAGVWRRCAADMSAVVRPRAAACVPPS